VVLVADEIAVLVPRLEDEDRVPRDDDHRDAIATIPRRITRGTMWSSGSEARRCAATRSARRVRPSAWRIPPMTH
jgi:hypothetical protein